MAGGKETPRQKMIGMMYLVLTALLALQVNSAILLKFKFIDDSLIDVNGKTNMAADNTVKNIQAAVDKNHNMASDVAVLKQSEEIRAKTKAMIAYLQDVRDKLIAGTGNVKGSPDFKDPDANNKVMPIMLGGKKNGLAYPLKAELNNYSTFIKTYVPNATPLALDGREDARIINSKEHTTMEQKNKDFAELNFENTPLVAALAVLSQKETAVLKLEADALSEQSKKVGAKIVSFDKIGAFASAESNTVAAGTKYKAELFLTASATGLQQKMTLNGSPLTVGPDGHGKVEFTARPGNFDASGNAKASWEGRIRFNQNGRDTTFVVKVPYTITKPVMQIQSASVQALYFKCGNKLNVSVPALGAQYKPSFSASGASAIQGAKVGDVTLIPNSKEVTLNVSSGGNAIGSQTFQVRPIPKPTIECWVGGRQANEKQGTPGTAVRSLTLRAIPDAGFATFLPDDAKFRVSRYEVTLVRGRRPAMQTKTISGPQADLSDVVNAYRDGDRLYIEVKDVQRQTFQGNVEPVSVSKQFNIPLL
ncbi:type IX secretion system motor protein PorM/GldM [Hymenobacter negativus]|uniref:Gliding motility protein GldM n=1 Tax=Hymenobacter negativus TaxID=2795026 RepID=A0ABS0Q7P6_9BACT|nr:MULTISPECIES: gliding motility protein GldM [Bacteria]MBH8558680.1 gliding motility protein GldM [Hymenobacter negativus]MBH8570216.1 gliding motility protein GldM [Hymenobacter negativus]MBR7209955.1 gliding motility protein GldM [Microvirga sp. STS02]